MKAIRIHQHGGIEVLKVEEIPTPKPAQGEVLVRMKAAAMNHMDLWVRQGMPGVKIPLPIILGCEGSGVVEAVGNDVKNFKKGDEVVVSPGTSCGQCEVCVSGKDHFCRHYEIYGENRDGMEAEYVVVSERDLFLKPKNISF
ncbi:MAG: alcohol dehydrogenase catalytic domain-containing protein, partial [Deltaproteobacteria bacterium]|nr:alcohol dehydrogenase catalytic domain-containing protein [Deltaproteobacteria bacterium]